MWLGSRQGLEASRDCCDSAQVSDTADYLSRPDSHLDPIVAARYDESHRDRFAPETLERTIEVLAELAGDGTAVEFAVGTGRVALPLAEAGVRVLGIDFSEPMLAELRKKDTSNSVAVTHGDMTTTQVCSDAALVYLVFNSLTNLREQALQVACFKNAAAHLAPGGCFVIEQHVPRLHQLPPGERIRPFNVSPSHLGFDEYVDLANQISVSHHYVIDGDRVAVYSPAFRYAWPSELDLMAQLAGMQLESRWADWDRSPFDGDSPSHVSVWRKAPSS